MINTAGFWPSCEAAPLDISAAEFAIVSCIEQCSTACQYPRRICLIGLPMCLGVGLAMQAVDVGLSSGLEEGLRFEAAAFGLAAATEDYKEGLQAFFEKRKPVFTGT